MAIAFEYLIHVIPLSSGTINWNTLQKFGEAGWEMVGVVSIPPSEFQTYGRIEYYFKRPKEIHRIEAANQRAIREYDRVRELAEGRA